MTKLSECISFPKEKVDKSSLEYQIDKDCCEFKRGYNKAIKECKDAVDKMELDVEKIKEIIKPLVPHSKGCFSGIAEGKSCVCGLTARLLTIAYKIADNLPKLLKEK